MGGVYAFSGGTCLNWSPFIVASDIHGDQQDLAAIRAFKDFCDVWRPKIRVINGDLWDVRPLRRGCSEDEKREGLRADLEAGNRFVDWFKPTTFLLGNHDVRLWDLQEKGTGVMREFAEDKVQEAEKLFAKLRCPILPYTNRDGLLEIGNLGVMHGFGSGLQMARRMVQAYGSLILGHLHVIDIVSVEAPHRRMGRISGCLCKLDMSYAQRNLASLRWQHGFAYGVVNEKTGDYFVWQAESVGGKWLLPTGFKEI